MKIDIFKDIQNFPHDESFMSYLILEMLSTEAGERSGRRNQLLRGDVVDAYELIEKWQNKHHAYSFEGDSGLAQLEDLCEAIGYRPHGFRFGTTLEGFLSDNPGACDAIVEFITESLDKSQEWRENLADELDLDPDADDKDDLEDGIPNKI